MPDDAGFGYSSHPACQLKPLRMQLETFKRCCDGLWQTYEIGREFAGASTRVTQRNGTLLRFTWNAYVGLAGSVLTLLTGMPGVGNSLGL